MALKNDSGFSVQLVSSAQHNDLLTPALNVFGLAPDVTLESSNSGGDLSRLHSQLLLRLSSAIGSIDPDCVLVHGDTTTALAGATASFYKLVPIGHVEAGLRTFHLSQPFPEEFNRQSISRVAQWNFAPTQSAKANLLSEGITDSSIFVTGNTVVDALLWIVNEIENNPELYLRLSLGLGDKLGFDPAEQSFVLFTGHRRESLGVGFEQIFAAVQDLAIAYSDIRFVFPVHPNPAVRGPAQSYLEHLNNVHLISPVSYDEFVFLMRLCLMIVTDSGGIQEEAPSLAKPVVVLRERTERQEGLDHGLVRLGGTSRPAIVHCISSMLKDATTGSLPRTPCNPYGDGNASARILDTLRRSLAP